MTRKETAWLVGVAAAFVLLAFLPLWSLVALGLGWALVSVAMRGTPPVAAILGGLRAAALNALPLFVFAAALLLPGLLVAGLFGLVMAAVVALASLLGPLVGGVVAMAMVLAFTVVFSAISYGFTLNGWRAACDDGEPRSPCSSPSAVYATPAVPGIAIGEMPLAVSS